MPGSGDRGQSPGDGVRRFTSGDAWEALDGPRLKPTSGDAWVALEGPRELASKDAWVALDGARVELAEAVRPFLHWLAEASEMGPNGRHEVAAQREVAADAVSVVCWCPGVLR